MTSRIITGDALTVLKSLPSESIHCCVTSPPYWSQRDYGTRQWFDGDSACEHDQAIEHGPMHPGQVPQTMSKRSRKITLYDNTKGEVEKEEVLDLNRTTSVAIGQTVTTCSCSKCGAWYGQLGLEPVPFDSGYKGPSYITHMVEIFRELRRVLHRTGTFWLNIGDTYATPTVAKRVPALKPKDLIGVPWRLALAMQEDGWFLRNDCVWAKVPARPESVRDRSSRNHEYVFMFSRSETYYYDKYGDKDADEIDRKRGRFSVWSIPPTSYGGDHFAAFDSVLPRVAIQLGTSEHGCCVKCLTPYEREEDGWVTRCKCKGDPVPCTVLDPFSGTGTTAAAATALKRDAIGIEVNPEYVTQSAEPLLKAEEAATWDSLFDEAVVQGRR